MNAYGAGTSTGSDPTPRALQQRRQQRQGSSRGSAASGASSELGSQVDEHIGRATKQLQRDLQGEQLSVHATLGEGGFGTVYKGACPNQAAGM